MDTSNTQTTEPTQRTPERKRLIVCCDGTWLNNDSGYRKTSLLGKKATLQVPSNVTRISRCMKRRCSDGTLQIISYESGVGSGSSTVDAITGGAFGLGLSERVREAYSYLCSNYMNGDEIFLVGFSRGAFTARSVAGMVSELGLLTREGVEQFYPIYKDMQNFYNEHYKDPFPTIPFPNKPKGKDAPEKYKRILESMGYTRVRQPCGELIKIKAVCVWDTVGSLGIPRVQWLNKMGIHIHHQDCTMKWHDTNLSDKIEHAFQALALDETRVSFCPAVWEQNPDLCRGTDLRQVWFPGHHSNIGGGLEDQGVANCTLAWMMDQMASVGVEFDRPSLDRIFEQSTVYYKGVAIKRRLAKTKKAAAALTWAVDPIYANSYPHRPWGMGKIDRTIGFTYWFTGQSVRTPSAYKETDPRTDCKCDRYLQRTNERVHSSVRVRWACKGLHYNDKGLYKSAALDGWRLKKVSANIDDPIPEHPRWEPEQYRSLDTNGVEGSASPQGRWIWEYQGDLPLSDSTPRVMVEEPLGPYERYMLRALGGNPNVWEYADQIQSSYVHS